MEEYSRIIIEEYCINHSKTKKADFLFVKSFAVCNRKTS